MLWMQWRREDACSKLFVSRYKISAEKKLFIIRGYVDHKLCAMSNKKYLRFSAPSIPIPRKSVAGQSPWKPISDHFLLWITKLSSLRVDAHIYKIKIFQVQHSTSSKTLTCVLFSVLKRVLRKPSAAVTILFIPRIWDTDLSKCSAKLRNAIIYKIWKHTWGHECPWPV